MIVTDIGEVHQRADALGKLGMSYGVGMVIGPLLGGLVTKHVRCVLKVQSSHILDLSNFCVYVRPFCTMVLTCSFCSIIIIIV